MSALTITKFGHSCLLIEQEGVRILTDPGMFSAIPAELADLDGIILTHEHPDHTHPETLHGLVVRQSTVKILTNRAVGEILAKEELTYEVCEAGQQAQVGSLTVEAFGRLHQSIVPDLAAVANTGYLIGGRVFTPGDAFTNPDRPVEILALPICAPWSKFSETLAYVVKIKPKIVIPIHDGFLIPHNPFQSWIERSLPPKGIIVKTLELGVATAV